MPGAMVLFSVEPILLELEGGRYVGPLLLAALVELVCGRRGVGNGSGSGGGGVRSGGGVGGSGGTSSGGGSSGGGGGINVGRSRCAGCIGSGAGTGGSRVSTRVQVHYEAHLPVL